MSILDVAASSLLPVPFHAMPQEKSNYCGQFVLSMALEYLTGKYAPPFELVHLTGKPEGGVTLTVGLANASLKSGLSVTLITLSAELLTDRDDEFAELANLEKSALLTLFNRLKGDALSKGLLIEERRPSLTDLEVAIKRDAVPIVVVDIGRLKKASLFLPHFLLVTGITQSTVFAHNVGPKQPKAHQPFSRSDFLEAWSAEGTDMDTLLLERHPSCS